VSADRPRRNLAADEAGATAVELAFILPVLVMLVFGVIQLGWALHCGSSVRYAVEQASRTVMLNPSTTQAQVQSQVTAALQGVADPNNVTVTLTFDTSSGTRVAKIAAVYTHTLSVPMLPGWTLKFRPQSVVPA
jgi:Flp pilus assembly protein TadG